MDVYLQPQDDGLPMRQSGQWAAEKLDYLQRYINIFETSMREKKWRARNYIDLFAGPGKCRVRSSQKVYLGSPLLAVTTTHPFTGYFFVDLDDSSIAALKARCSNSAIAQRIQYTTGDGNVAVRQIVSQIQATDHRYVRGAWPSLNLAFLDPAGVDLTWETVVLLSQVSRMDLIIHYPQYGLNLCMKQASQAQGFKKVDAFFGGTAWRDIYAKYTDKPPARAHSELIDYYRDGLKKLGYEEVRRDDETGEEPLMRNAQKNAPLYRLLFASKHQLGKDFWHAVTRRNVDGQTHMF